MTPGHWKSWLLGTATIRWEPFIGASLDVRQKPAIPNCLEAKENIAPSAVPMRCPFRAACPITYHLPPILNLAGRGFADKVLNPTPSTLQTPWFVWETL